MLYKLDNDQQAVDELEALAKIFQNEAEYFFNFGNAHAMRRHQSAARLMFNPFRQFLGSYKVGAVTCTSKGWKNPEKSLSNSIELLENPQNGGIEMTRKWDRMGMTATDQLVEDGTLSIVGGSVGTMFGSDNSGSEFGEMFSEYGTRWSDHWIRDWFRVEKRWNGLFCRSEARHAR